MTNRSLVGSVADYVGPVVVPLAVTCAISVSGVVFLVTSPVVVPLVLAEAAFSGFRAWYRQ